MTTSSAKGAAERVELTRLQATAARRAAEAKATMPHVYATAAIVLNPSALLVAVAKALRAVPELNAAYVDGAIERYDRVNLGIALDGPVVPTIFDADDKDAAALGAELGALQARAPDDFTAPELAGATFTIHGLGVAGLGSFTPVLVPRQAAGLGVGAAGLRLAGDARMLGATELGRFLERLAGA